MTENLQISPKSGDKINLNPVQLQPGPGFLQTIVDSVREPSVILDHDLKVTFANASFYKRFQLTPLETQGGDFIKLGKGEWDLAHLKQKLDKLIAQGGQLQNIEIEAHFANLGKRSLLLSGRLVESGNAGEPLILLVLEDVTERKETLGQVLELHQALEQKTKDLELCNQELAAFSHSVSHDLRAPLRSIDGFSKALLEDYSTQLDDDGRNYLTRVRAASQQMGKLIDGLLSLSQLVRSEIYPEELDLSRMAESILTGLKETSSEREVELVVAPNLKTTGDRALLNLALKHLLENAWKFTSKKPASRIEFGSTQFNGSSAYFVADNGAGFDATYSSRLFLPFQRLHDPEEFPGAGIGLAAAWRVVARHGGKIWAKSQVGEGTTFYFTLNLKP